MSDETEVDLSSFLDEKLRPRTVPPGQLLTVGIFLIVIGAISLLSSSLRRLWMPTPLPPYPNSSQRTKILQSATLSATVRSKIPINSATVEELDDLPGIGIVRAQTILLNRPYVDESDLRLRTGLGTSVIEKLLPYVEF